MTQTKNHFYPQVNYCFIVPVPYQYLRLYSFNKRKVCFAKINVWQGQYCSSLILRAIQGLFQCTCKQ